MIGFVSQIQEFHRIFAGGFRWRVTAQGVECENSGLITPSAAARSRTSAFIVDFGPQCTEAARETGVFVELLIACGLTESGVGNPARSLRLEPGYVSDEATPHRVSAGLCQTLISTAREVMKDPAVDRQWLFSPRNSLTACARYMRRQSALTKYDPVAVACAYNAGGLYEQKGAANRWRLRQFPIGTPKHADRFVEYFNAAMAEPGLSGCPRYGEWLAASIVK